MYVPEPATTEDLCRFHTKDFVDALKNINPSNKVSK